MNMFHTRYFESSRANCTFTFQFLKIHIKQHLTSGCQEVLLLLLLMVCLSYNVNYEVEVCRSRFAWAVLKLHHLNTVFLNTCILFL